MTDSPAENRYARQELLKELGREAQRRLAESSVLQVGCGALGSVVAELLVRAGVGRLRLADRDVVELVNLHRQLLYDEQDVAQCLPKAEAARRRLLQMNSTVAIEARVADVAPHNVRELLAGVDLVIDGTDNVETRYLLNDACLEAGRPWIYGGAVGVTGMTFNILPGEGPCLRCVFPEPAPPGSLPTCDTLGVLNSLPTLIGALQATEALKILTQPTAASRQLVVVDAWQQSQQTIEVKRDPRCPACAHGRRDFLDGREVTSLTRLCGRNAVQVDPPQELGVELQALQQILSRSLNVEFNGHLLRFWADGLEVLLFPDGRAIVRGTTDPIAAKRVYARYVGA
jgi:molybdopterin-synthase adenylyltransferase